MRVQHFLFVASFLTSAFIVACGGGGGGGSSSSSTSTTSSCTAALPNLYYSTSYSATVGTALTITPSSLSTMPSGCTPTITATGLPAGLSISSSTGIITGTPTTAATSSVAVSYTVRDSAGNLKAATPATSNFTIATVNYTGPAFDTVWGNNFTNYFGSGQVAYVATVNPSGTFRLFGIDMSTSTTKYAYVFGTNSKALSKNGAALTGTNSNCYADFGETACGPTNVSLTSAGALTLTRSTTVVETTLLSAKTTNLTLTPITVLPASANVAGTFGITPKIITATTTSFSGQMSTTCNISGAIALNGTNTFTLSNIQFTNVPSQTCALTGSIFGGTGFINQIGNTKFFNILFDKVSPYDGAYVYF